MELTTAIVASRDMLNVCTCTYIHIIYIIPLCGIIVFIVLGVVRIYYIQPLLDSTCTCTYMYIQCSISCLVTNLLGSVLCDSV